MKLRNLQFILLATILSMPLIFNSCQTSDEIVFKQEKLFTKDSEIVPLLLKALGAEDSSNFNKSFTDEDNQCTEFVYPMTFYAYGNDAEDPSEVIINNDEEFIEFLTTLTSGQEFFITYPVTLLDVDGVETVISDYPDLEGILTMLVDVCIGRDDDKDACKCKGEVNALDLEYLGGKSDVNIVVYEGKVKDDKIMTTFENINKGDILSFVGNKKDNKMGSKIFIVIDGDVTNAIEIHTSCSQDILIGMTFGDFKVKGGGSSKGGEFCDPGDDVKYEYCHKKNKKIVICHNGKSICISINAILGHMSNHSDDYFGSCNN